jgi:predicted TIM-barrel fold metal-dependent hydrolase
MNDSDLLVSADSHVIEDPHLWERRLPARFRDAAPVFPERGIGGPFQSHPGAWDSAARVEEMATDGVSQEVLYPSLTMMLFGLADPSLQRECFLVYNDWIGEYCAAAPDRLFAIAALSAYDIDHAVRELERRRADGAVGAMVWEVPPDELSFATAHYDPLWEAAQALQVPISLHSQTGAPYRWPRERGGDKTLVGSARKANRMTFEGANAVSDLIASGALHRFPELHFVLVENEASWIPGFLSRYDNYYARTDAGLKYAPRSDLAMEPSRYFARQFSATFFNDPTLGALLGTWGSTQCMWSNDYPHANSTWPHSRAVIERDLGHLDREARRRVLSANAVELYRLPTLAEVAA